MRYRGPKAKVMRRYVAEAMRSKGPTGTNLLQLLEQRLDSLVYRLGFAPSIWAARQLVGHGHVLVSGERVDIPSYEVRPGQTITISEKMKRSRQMAVWAERGGIVPPPYLELDRDHLAGRLVRSPDRDEIPVPINDRLIVEFYSR